MITVVAVLAVAALGQSPPADPPAKPGAPPSSEEALWQAIETLQASTPTTKPFEEWYRESRGMRTQLLERLRLYLSLYPGGIHRDEAIRLELETLYEIGSLRGGDISELCQVAARYRKSPPSRVVEEEAAYWLLLCGQTRTTATEEEATTQPSPRPLRKLDADSVAAMREYLRRYPKSRYVPRLGTRLFDWAARRGDRERMLEIVKHLGTHFPDHIATMSLLARWNREETVGRPFPLDVRTLDGRRIVADDLVGRPTLIVVWAGYDRAARESAAAIERYRQDHQAFRVIGISLDETPDATREACATMGIEWPQVSDGTGWGGEFVRTWGVREVPFVFVLDRGGRLLGWASDAGWRGLADAARGAPKTPPD